MNLECLKSILILIIWLPVFGHAQSNTVNHKIDIEIPEVALLGLATEGSADIDFNINSPEEAGNSINLNDVQKSNVWINYSSVITHSNHKRKVVAMVSGELPYGFRLMVEASGVTGSGKGKLGQSKGFIALTNEPAELITDIGSCFTGKGAKNGHSLTYKIELDETANNFASMSQVHSSVHIIYTLTDQD